MKSRDVVGVLVGLILGVLGMTAVKSCGGGGGGGADAGSEAASEAAPVEAAPVDAVAVADAVAADDAAAPSLDGALSAAALSKCPKCPVCPGACKAGQTLPCFGCQQGSQRQMPGTRQCVGNTWGPCSAGPDCLGP